MNDSTNVYSAENYLVRIHDSIAHPTNRDSFFLWVHVSSWNAVFDLQRNEIGLVSGRPKLTHGFYLDKTCTAPNSFIRFGSNKIVAKENSVWSAMEVGMCLHNTDDFNVHTAKHMNVLLLCQNPLGTYTYHFGAGYGSTFSSTVTASMERANGVWSRFIGCTFNGNLTIAQRESQFHKIQVFNSAINGGFFHHTNVVATPTMNDVFDMENITVSSRIEMKTQSRGGTFNFNRLTFNRPKITMDNAFLFRSCDARNVVVSVRNSLITSSFTGGGAIVSFPGSNFDGTLRFADNVFATQGTAPFNFDSINYNNIAVPIVVERNMFDVAPVVTSSFEWGEDPFTRVWSHRPIVKRYASLQSSSPRAIIQHDSDNVHIGGFIDVVLNDLSNMYLNNSDVCGLTISVAGEFTTHSVTNTIICKMNVNLLNSSFSSHVFFTDILVGNMDLNYGFGRWTTLEFVRLNLTDPYGVSARSVLPTGSKLLMTHSHFTRFAWCGAMQFTLVSLQQNKIIMPFRYMNESSPDFLFNGSTLAAVNMTGVDMYNSTLNLIDNELRHDGMYGLILSKATYNITRFLVTGNLFTDMENCVFVDDNLVVDRVSTVSFYNNILNCTDMCLQMIARNLRLNFNQNQMQGCGFEIVLSGDDPLNIDGSKLTNADITHSGDDDQLVIITNTVIDNITINRNGGDNVTIIINGSDIGSINITTSIPMTNDTIIINDTRIENPADIQLEGTDSTVQITESEIPGLNLTGNVTGGTIMFEDIVFTCAPGLRAKSLVATGTLIAVRRSLLPVSADVGILFHNTTSRGSLFSFNNNHFNKSVHHSIYFSDLTNFPTANMISMDGNMIIGNDLINTTGEFGFGFLDATLTKAVIEFSNNLLSSVPRFETKCGRDWQGPHRLNFGLYLPQMNSRVSHASSNRYSGASVSVWMGANVTDVRLGKSIDTRLSDQRSLFSAQEVYNSEPNVFSSDFRLHHSNISHLKVVICGVNSSLEVYDTNLGHISVWNEQWRRRPVDEKCC